MNVGPPRCTLLSDWIALAPARARISLARSAASIAPAYALLRRRPQNRRPSRLHAPPRPPALSARRLVRKLTSSIVATSLSISTVARRLRRRPGWPVPPPSRRSDSTCGHPLQGPHGLAPCPVRVTIASLAASRLGCGCFRQPRPARSPRRGIGRWPLSTASHLGLQPVALGRGILALLLERPHRVAELPHLWRKAGIRQRQERRIELFARQHLRQRPASDVELLERRLQCPQRRRRLTASRSKRKPVCPPASAVANASRSSSTMQCPPAPVRSPSGSVPADRRRLRNRSPPATSSPFLEQPPPARKPSPNSVSAVSPSTACGSRPLSPASPPRISPSVATARPPAASARRTLS